MECPSIRNTSPSTSYSLNFCPDSNPCSERSYPCFWSQVWSVAPSIEEEHRKHRTALKASSRSGTEEGEAGRFLQVK
ncbi:hypothetical protein L1987_36923 [Smallanthus sonchifolius]|uniref:Uncharacterized protein n=1 Tax=Smallanthus sonchifolius TaxID=185202 RepID=A0ACB9HES6_9ASTR|nr:hypothetical protein L1987_36923 [Smallanthus sonchifolius]